jgi:hypothetical protein
MNTKLVTLKNKTQAQLPALAAGVVVGGATVAYIAYRRYHPKDMIAMQLPNDALRKLTEEGKGLVFPGANGWFVLKYEPAK